MIVLCQQESQTEEAPVFPQLDSVVCSPDAPMTYTLIVTNLCPLLLVIALIFVCSLWIVLMYVLECGYCGFCMC